LPSFGDASTIAAQLRERYAGLVDRLAPYQAFAPTDPLWRALARDGG
jgi:hypothetical protein